MSFTFRGEDLKVSFFCVDISDGKMVPTDNRFDFHTTTKNKSEKGKDLCHRYSFSAMQQLLCLIYNSGDHSKLETLIATLFPRDVDDDDRKNAFAVYDKIINKPVKAVKYYNQLLYILNNSLFNLRPGNSSWNRSIGMCYDPSEWEFDGKKFIITSEEDVFILSNLLHIKVNPSTIYFYTAKDSGGNPVLYSSNNGSVNQGIGEYQQLNIPIYIYPYDENGNQFEMRIS